MGKLALFIKKHNKKLMTLADILVIPALFLCRKMTEIMFATGKPCRWTVLGIECATCGGTRCVSSLLNGRIFDAYMYNPMVFSGIVLMAVIFVLMNFSVFFKLKFADRALGFLLQRRTVFFCIAVFLTFFVARNFIPLIESILFC